MGPVRILQELEQTTYELPGQPRKQMVILYQVEGRPPRSVWIYKDLLPDLMWLEEHPGETEPPAELQAKGDEVRKKAFEDDQAKLLTRQPRTLT